MHRALVPLAVLTLALAPHVARADDAPAAPAAPAAPSSDGQGVGLSSSTPQVGDLILPTRTAPATEAASSSKKFSFHGFLRVPLAVGFGPGDGVPDGVEGGKKTHSPPQIPDGAYTDWQYTNNMGGPWTELWLSYGNANVAAHVVIASYQVSEGGYRDLQAQLGISQSFVSLDYPKLFGDAGGLSWNVGAFTGRYGTAGRYDAGKYDTYLFGATKVAGETLALSYQVVDGLTLHLEHGLGAKLEVPPLVPGLPSVPYLPYPGPVQQGTTLLHHLHLGATWQRLTFAMHYLSSWNDDARLPGEIDGRISVVGAELKLSDSVYGNGYLGYAHLSARDPLRVADAIEVIHSQAGWNLRDNYFGQSTNGTGTIDTILFQHTFSLATFLWAPEPFWGQAPDLLLSVFGMYNKVASDDPGFTGPTQKLKLGAEVTYSWKSFLAASFRYDLVQPDMDDSHESFQVLSPRLIVRSDFASNEQLVVQYSHYLNGSRVRLSYPSGGLVADEDVLRISAVMWW
jgi:hypothetical protein